MVEKNKHTGICKYCGTKLKNGRKTCTHCAEKLEKWRELKELLNYIVRLAREENGYRGR